jgi:hypothetical protein
VLKKSRRLAGGESTEAW